MSSGEHFAADAANAKPIEGYHDVIVHGSPTDFGATADAWVDGTNFSHRTLARLIEGDPAYDGGPIRLLSCSTGACEATAAQNLANELWCRGARPNGYGVGVPQRYPCRGTLANHREWWLGGFPTWGDGHDT